MFLVVGLGNPGQEYENTRHNVGFMAVDQIFDRYCFSSFKEKFDSLLAEGQIGKEKVLLLKPKTFMNLSGNAVVKAALFYKILPENIIVIHDDVDLDFGKLKAKRGGSSAGHNGLKSIDANITPLYNRIRIGIGRPAHADFNMADYVLSRFSKADEKTLQNSLNAAADAVEVLIENGIASCANFLGMFSAQKK